MILALAGGPPPGGNRTDSGPPAPAGDGIRDPTAIALVGVHVVPADRDTVLRDHTVIVRAGRIAGIGPEDRTEVPEGAVRPEIRGLYVVPGLIDMHVHLAGEDLPAYLAAGVTTVRNMWGWEETAAIREGVAEGSLPSLRVYSTGPAVDGSPPVRPGADVVTGPADVPPLLRRQAAAGWEFIKVYQNLELDAFDALARAAEEAGLPLVGHVPTAVPLGRALAAMASIEHLEGYDKALTGSRRRGFRAWLDAGPAAVEAMAGLAEATAAAGVWNCPTLLVAERVLGAGLTAAERRRAAAARRAMVRALHEAGAPLLAGTDGGTPLVPAGALAEELAGLVAAGLTPYEALRTATVDAARFLEAEASFGRVEEGLEADLVLLSGNPLESIDALQRPRAVMVDGLWLEPAAPLRFTRPPPAPEALSSPRSTPFGG